MKKPSFQFYPADWIIDPGLSTLDYFHVGVFIKLLCYASQAGGELRYCDGGALFTMTDLSNLLGLEANKTKQVIDTLLAHGCLKMREDGCLYNARMVKDCQEAKEYYETRKRSAEIAANARWKNRNPNTSDAQCERNASRISDASDTQCQNDASSSTSSSSYNINTHTNAQAREAEPILPKNMPATAQQAVELCIGLGVPDDFIIQAWNNAYAVGFRDRQNPIMNWPAYINAYYMRFLNAQERKKQRNCKQEPPKDQYPTDRMDVPSL